MRLRTDGDAARQAAYNWPAWRVLKRCAASAAAIRWHSSALARAIGTRYFIATWAQIAPARTCCCTVSGSSSTSASRRDTQLTVRSKQRANSSSP